MTCSLHALFLVASMVSTNTAAGHDRCVDSEPLLQTSMQFMKLADPPAPEQRMSYLVDVPGSLGGADFLAKDILPGRSMFWEASAAIEMETASENDSDPTSLFMPGTPAQNIKTIVFFCSIAAALLAYIRFGLNFRKTQDDELLHKCQLLEELARMDQGENGSSTRHKGSCDKDPKSDADTDLPQEAGETNSDSTDAYTDPDGVTDADTDTEADMYDGHGQHETGDMIQLR